MTLRISGDITLRNGWQPMDPDAAAYITAVESADGQALEEKVKIAIDNFVLGCKADGVWDAIKASCILAGARTLDGALVPLVGGAPTNNNFVSADYDRETGLVGDGSTKYLSSNRNNNADPQNNHHISVYATNAGASATAMLIGAGGSTGASGATHINRTALSMVIRNRSSTFQFVAQPADATGFIGTSRSNPNQYQARVYATTSTINQISEAPFNQTIQIFANEGVFPNSARLAFYSIGEALDLALLDARVTDLINKFAEVIP